MGFEVDFLPVGDGERCGDAIALRFGNLNGPRSDQRVIVIDGGYQDDGDALVKHINANYGTNKVNLVVSTHSDQDHVSGLHVVLEQMEVAELWMHSPWQRSVAAKRALSAHGIGLAMSERVQKSLQSAQDLHSLALRKGISVTAPFAGLTDTSGCLRVLSPTEEFYGEMLSEFDKSASLLGRVAAKARGIIRTITESWSYETLDDSGETSAVNEASTILLLSVDGKNILFTADAGQRALGQVLDIFDGAAITNGFLDLIQIPHHGSHRSLSPQLLDRLLGLRLPEAQKEMVRRRACVSAAKDAPKHPSKKVTNAFLRRGTPVYSTEGRTLWYHSGAPARGWGDAAALPFFSEVQE